MESAVNQERPPTPLHTPPDPSLLQNGKTLLKYQKVGGALEHRHPFFPKPLRSATMAVKVELDKCTGCGECVAACPLDAIAVKDKKAVVDDSCAECGACIDACPNKALSL